MSELLLIFILNLFTSTLSQLKYMLASKSSSWQMYAIVGVDSILYLYSLSLVLGSAKSTMMGMVVLTIGKLLGITVANIVENTFVKKVYSLNLFVPTLEQSIAIENFCYDNNISIVTIPGTARGEDRYVVNVHLNNKQKDDFESFLRDNDISNTSFTTNITQTNGRIAERT